METRKVTGIIEDNILNQFIPPIANETEVGGIVAKERTDENNEVVIDYSTGKAYVKKISPNWNAEENNEGYIENKPTIPTKVSELENDSGYLKLSDSDVLKDIAGMNLFSDILANGNTVYTDDNGKVMVI